VLDYWHQQLAQVLTEKWYATKWYGFGALKIIVFQQKSFVKG
jgi:hypothetical protein